MLRANNLLNTIESEHIVRPGPGLSPEEATEIRVELEYRYPTRPNSEFVIKLFPLSVGAWLLIIRSEDYEETETLAVEPTKLEVDSVLRTVDMLVQRWRTHRDVSK